MEVWSSRFLCNCHASCVIRPCFPTMHEIGGQHHQQQQQQQQQTGAQLMSDSGVLRRVVLWAIAAETRRRTSPSGELAGPASPRQPIAACKCCCASVCSREAASTSLQKIPTTGRQAKQAQASTRGAGQKATDDRLADTIKSHACSEGSVRCETDVPDRRHVPRRWGSGCEVLMEVVGEIGSGKSKRIITSSRRSRSSL